MADIIDKIGKYFAEQEQQLRQAYTQTSAHAALPPTTYPRTPVQPPPRRQQQQQSAEPDALSGSHSIKGRQEPSLLRRRLSQQSNSSTAASASDTPAIVPTAVPPLALSPPPASQTFPKRGCGDASSWNAEGAWSDDNDDDFASWRSVQSSYNAKLPTRAAQSIDRSVAHPEVESSDGNRDGGGSQASGSNSKPSSSSAAKPRKIPLKRRGSLKKKRRPISTKHLVIEPDPEQVKREKQLKVAAALVLAQERAKRIQAEKQQQMRERELANREEQRRVQEEMEKIEAIRLKSKQFALRLRPSLVPNTPGAPPSGSISSQSSRSSQLYSELGSVDCNDNNNCPDSEGDNEPPVLASEDPDSSPTFLDVVERQLRDRMVIELRVREKSLASQQAQEQEWARVCSQLEKQNACNKKKQERITHLKAAKQSLESEFLKVQEQLQASRSQRFELEESSRQERVHRQRDAERQLRARVHTEEWNRMLDDEKVRSEVAAEARERASQRVVSRASSLMKKALESKKKSRQRRRAASDPSSNNNEKDEDDEDKFELLRARLHDGRPKFGLLFAPELAEFEEDGLLSDEAVSAKPILLPELGSQGPETMASTVNPHEKTMGVAETTEEEPSVPETDVISLDQVQPVEPSEEVPKFQWRVPPFEDRRLFDSLLLHEMLLTSLSDSE